jgi:ferredoxin
MGMIRVRFVDAAGTATDITTAEGARLLDVAQAAGQPLEGTCDGDMARATSRLACQIWLTAALDGLTVRVPG